MSGGDWKSLYTAIALGDIDTVNYHLREGVDPNYQHPEILCTPLVEAIKHGQREIAIALLKAGADPQLKSVFEDLSPKQALRKWPNNELAKLVNPNPSTWEKIRRRLHSIIQKNS